LVEKYFSVKEAYDYQSQKLEKLERLQKDPLWNDTINQDKQEIMRDNYKLSGFE